MKPVQVAVVKCDSYERELVQKAVERAFGLLGGLDRLLCSLGHEGSAGTLVTPDHSDSALTSGGACLIKPNMLFPSLPEEAITTHPEVVRAAAVEAKKVAQRVCVGDSPGRDSTLRAAEVSGIAQACRDLSIDVVPFDEAVEVKFSEGRVCKELTLARPVVEASSVINVAKMKTHGFMTYTGAVKNLFGCIPGMRKAKMHLRYSERREFALLLLDLAFAVRPAVSVIDAVVAMDGDGPSHGRPRPFGAIIVSVDPVAADSVALRLAGVDPMRVPYLRAAAEFYPSKEETRDHVAEKDGTGARRFGAVNPKDIDILGDSPSSFDIRDFRLPDSGSRASVFDVVGKARKSVTARPVVDAAKCTGCGVCSKACPPTAITMSPVGGRVRAAINLERCIRCYCCHEMCPSGAISLRMGPVARAVDRFLEAMKRR